MSRKKTEQEKAQALLAAIQDNDIEGWSDAGFDECDHVWVHIGDHVKEPDGWTHGPVGCQNCDETAYQWCAPKQTDPPTYYHGFDGNWYPEPREGDQHV